MIARALSARREPTPFRGQSPRKGLTVFELIVVLVVLGIIIALLLPAIMQTREAARRGQCLNNLLMIGLGIHNYENAFKRIPPAMNVPLSADSPKPGSPEAGFSWHVHLLPFMEHQRLYDTLDVREGAPFDGNRRHLEAASSQLEYFRCPSYRGGETAEAPEYAAMEQPPTVSNYVGFGATHLASLYQEEDRPSIGEGNPNGILAPGRSLRFSDIRDGLTKTLMACETAEEKYAAWIDGTTASVVALAEETKPKFIRNGADVSIADGVAATIGYSSRWEARHQTPEVKPPVYCPADRHSGQDAWANGPGSHHPGVVNVLYSDGTASSFARDIDPRLFMLLICRDDGERISVDFFD